jgi:hypothetical protein
MGLERGFVMKLIGKFSLTVYGHGAFQEGQEIDLPFLKGKVVSVLKDWEESIVDYKSHFEEITVIEVQGIGVANPEARDRSGWGYFPHEDALIKEGPLEGVHFGMYQKIKEILSLGKDLGMEKESISVEIQKLLDSLS